jgi:hypothetical protein
MKKSKKLLLLIPVIGMHLFSIAQNIGIGTTSPQEKLHVTGAVRTDSLKIGTGSSLIRGMELNNTVSMMVDVNAQGGDADGLTGFGWQSFTATSYAMLDHVSIGLEQGYTIGELRIYGGEGTSGPLLASVTMPPGAAGYNNSPALNVSLHAGEKYTIWVANKMHWLYAPFLYPGGRASIHGNMDYSFKVFAREYLSSFNLMGGGAGRFLLEQPGSELLVNGKIITNQLQIPGSGGSGRLLVSDTYGNATWQLSNNYWVTGSQLLYLTGQPNLNQDGIAIRNILGTTYVDHKGSGSILFRADNSDGTTTRMAIDAGSGNIGINIAPDPVFNLTVNGAAKFIGGIQNEGPIIITGDVLLSGEISQPDLSTPTLQNSWVTAPGFREPRFYRGRDKRVYLQGSVRNGVGNVIYTLPTGYRPESEIRFAVSSTGGVLTLRIDSAGSVICSTFGPFTVSLDGVSFRVN